MTAVTYNNGTFTTTDRRADAALNSIYSNMIVHGLPSEIRFREAVAEMISEGFVVGPLSALSGPFVAAV
jgi:hypothetical protein